MTEWKGEKGAVLPLVALALIVIVLLVGLAVDLGHVHNVKIELQRAVDAAALAGTQRLLPDDATNATVAAEATARANTVDTTLIGVLIDGASMPPLVITPGQWDSENLTLADRFAENVTPYNAVQVTATRTVEHFFFFPFDPTISADAIAVKQPEVLTLPLAIVSCIPSTGEKKGEFNICGIETYNFAGSSKEGEMNVAGWTSLTIGAPGGASQNEILEFFDDEGADLFNRVTKLLEETNNKPPEYIDPDQYDSNYLGCEDNRGENIVCGLGGEFDPSKYLDPATSSLDPLERYAQNGTDALPRLITLDDTEIKTFNDILSQDGSLLLRDGESWDDYQARLARLYKGEGIPGTDYNSTTVNPDRFQPLNGKGFIEETTDKNDIDGDGDKGEDLYTPRLNRVLDYAGYPPVWATTGSMTTLMAALLDKVVAPGNHEKDVQFLPLGNEYAPFDGKDYEDPPNPATQGVGKTLKFTIPVIHAGSCVGFDPDSHASNDTSDVQEDKELHYVGLANLLITRILKGGQCFYHIGPVHPITATQDGCTDESLGLTPDGGSPTGVSFQCPEQINPPGSITFEGLVRPPGLGGEDQENAGIFDRVFLVE